MNRQTYLTDIINQNRFVTGAELGLWDGRTYLHLLRHCPDLMLIGVDLWKSQGIYTGVDKWGNDWSEQSHQEHEKKVRGGAAKYGDRSIIYKMSTVDAAHLVAPGSLDFVFIDADHSYMGVVSDIRAWSSKIKPGGLLMGHDIDWDSVRKAVIDEIGNNYIICPDNVWSHAIS